MHPLPGPVTYMEAALRTPPISEGSDFSVPTAQLDLNGASPAPRGTVLLSRVHTVGKLSQPRPSGPGVQGTTQTQQHFPGPENCVFGENQ